MPLRKEVAQKYKWNLTAMYQSDASWEDDFLLLQKKYKQLRTFKGVLHQPRKLLEFIQKLETAYMIQENLYVYAHMKATEDLSNKKYQEMSGRISLLSSDISSALVFKNDELSRLSKKEIDESISKEKRLAPYRYFLQEYARYKPHVLSQETEQALAELAVALDKPDEIFSAFNNVTIEFPSVTHKGKDIQLSHGVYSKCLESKDRELRKKVYHAYNSPFLRHRDTIGNMLGARILGATKIAKIKKFKSSLQMSLFADAMPQKVYDNLVEVATQHAGVLQKYCTMKKKELKVSVFEPYDIYAPVTDYAHEYTYEKVVEITRESLKVMGDTYMNAYEDVMTSRVVDVFENTYKRSGAYSWGSYKSRGYILLNFTGKNRDLSTFTHEMGHCLHRDFSIKEQSFFYYQNPIVLAEVASTCNEILLFEYLLQQEGSKKFKKYVLEEYMKLYVSTFYRQTFFAHFEKEAHALAEAGGVLTHESMTKVYKKLINVYYGKAVEQKDELTHEWLRVPHFYSSFYVYKYATSVCVATAIAKKILAGERGAIESYMKFLSAGSHKEPLKILKDAGVDLTQKSTFEVAPQKLAELLKRYEELS